MSPGELATDFRARALPLPPRAVWAEGAAATAMLRRLLSRSDEALARLEGVGGPGLLVLVGDELPWADGCVYLGRDERAPSLLLPCLLEPRIPPGLLERALLAKFPRGLLAVRPAPEPRVVAVDGARPLSRQALLTLAPP